MLWYNQDIHAFRKKKSDISAYFEQTKKKQKQITQDIRVKSQSWLYISHFWGWSLQEKQWVKEMQRHRRTCLLKALSCWGSCVKPQIWCTSSVEQRPRVLSDSYEHLIAPRLLHLVPVYIRALKHRHISCKYRYIYCSCLHG